MQPNVFYIHIFKCAGNAVKAPVQFRYRLEKLRPYYNFDIPPSHDWYWDNITEEERQSVWFFFGHFRNGQTYSNLKKLSPRPSLFFTVLRDPVERVISSYYYNRLDKCAKDPLHKYFKKYSLEECLHKDVIDQFDPYDKRFWLEILCDHQTRILSGLPHWSKKSIYRSPVRIDDLARAQEILSEFALVGFTETLYRDWNRLYKPLLRGTEIPKHLLKNKANETPDKPTVSADIRAKIARYNVYDRLLYHWAQEQRIGW